METNPELIAYIAVYIPIGVMSCPPAALLFFAIFYQLRHIKTTARILLAGSTAMGIILFVFAAFIAEPKLSTFLSFLTLIIAGVISFPLLLKAGYKIRGVPYPEQGAIRSLRSTMQALQSSEFHEAIVPPPIKNISAISVILPAVILASTIFAGSLYLAQAVDWRIGDETSSAIGYLSLASIPGILGWCFSGIASQLIWGDSAFQWRQVVAVAFTFAASSATGLAIGVFSGASDGIIASLSTKAIIDSIFIIGPISLACGIGVVSWRVNLDMQHYQNNRPVRQENQMGSNEHDEGDESDESNEGDEGDDSDENS